MISDIEETSGLPEENETQAQTPVVAPLQEGSDLPEEAPLSETPVEEVTTEADASEPAEVEIEVEAPATFDASAIHRREGVNPKANCTRETTSALKPKEQALLNAGEFVYIPTADAVELNLVAEFYPTLDLSKSETGMNWIGAVLAGQKNLYTANAFHDSVEREDSLWSQVVPHKGEQLGIRRPQLGEPQEGGLLTGEQAMMKMQAVLGLGAIVRIPLWHSGIWVSLKAPSESALLELDRRIANEKVLLGRISNGLVFSNTSVYMHSFLLNFALDHMYEATVKYNKPSDLKKLIDINDLPTLLWGLICTIYPNGYPYKRPCVTDPSKCTHIVEELLAINKLSWTDERSLTDWQRDHMVKRNAKVSLEDIKRYKEEHKYNKNGTLQLRDNLTVVLRVPTLDDYEKTGFAWVDGLVNMVDQAFGGTIQGEERDRFIMEQSAMTALRQYAHWIDRVVLEGKHVINDRSSIDDVIGTLTSDDQLYTDFFNGMGAFINDTTISTIAVPKFDCPACKKPMSTEEKAHPHLIPLDVTSIFFTLVGHRISKVLSRANSQR